MQWSSLHASLCAAMLVAVIAMPLGALADDAAAAQARIAAMTAEERAQLVRNQERFNQLTAAEQQRLRELNAELSRRPDEQQLRQVMASYHEWYKTLPPAEKAKLSELPANEKLAKVKQLREAQLQASKGGILSEDDAHKLGRWVHETARRRQEAIVQNLLPEQREELKGLPDRNRMFGGRLVVEMFQQIDRGNNIITPEDIQGLQDELSSEAGQALATAGSHTQRVQLVKNWHEARMRSGMQRMAMRHDRLKQFFEQLPASEQKELLNIADPGQLFAALWGKYWDHLLADFEKQLAQGQRQQLAAIEDADKRKAALARMYFEHQTQEFVQQLPTVEQERLAAIEDEDERRREIWRLFVQRERSEGRGGPWGGFERDGPRERRGRFEKFSPENRGRGENGRGPRPSEGRGPGRRGEGPAGPFPPLERSGTSSPADTADPAQSGSDSPGDNTDRTTDDNPATRD